VLVYELYNDSLTFRHEDREKIIEGWRLNARANAIGWAAHPNAALDLIAKALPQTVDFLRIRLVQASSHARLVENARFWWDPTLSGRLHTVGLAFYEANLIRMARYLLAHGNVPLGIVTQATLIRENNGPEERRHIHYVYRGLAHSQLWMGYRAAWEINRIVARTEPNVFLIEAQQSVPPTLELFHDEVHLNDAGSRLLAGVVADGVLARFAPRAGRVPRPQNHDLPRLDCVKVD
jgi:hypothetical protein